ncbi:hypothetical protein PPERSA_12039 [Pseudocohnilembus persalinus]|uniref:Uncharacterized protein n=1 Tax=Pseudocohnilembus persalinus TaxID=266149 RepID=A0A0V0R8W8_PSEPJ|nr:hypothetical protein PPERSA_12039 [Pseudocohnilembus persalinus]|eukprot:KRX10915.1 hypothetical protein PPERSA_12039 [Pseudocohnilembus persalinus]
MKFKIPYNFTGLTLDKKQVALSGNKLLNKYQATFYLGEGIYGEFSKIYTEILQAMADQDVEFLQSVMEPKLFQRTVQGLEELNQKGYTLKYVESIDSNPGEEVFPENVDVNEEQQTGKLGISINFGKSDPFQYLENDMKIYLQAKGIFGLNIDRHLNKDRKYFSLKGTFSGKEFYFNLQDFWAVYNNQILSLNVYFRTNRQLYITDEEGDVVIGNDEITDKLIRHKFKFETYTPKLDWVLVDIDDALNGNPYLPSQESNL